MSASRQHKPRFQRDTRRANYRLSRVADRADVDIGGDGESFKPSVRSSKWGGEAWLEMTARDCAKQGAAESIVERDGREILTAEIERTARGKGRGREGRRRSELHELYVGDSFDWDVVWQSANDLPDDTNEDGDRVVEFDLSQPEGLTFTHQPALTQSEIDDGCERPDNIVNSYAAYWNKSGRFLNADGTERINYETGKFGHLKRPLFLCADGSRFWGRQIITGDNLLTVTLPREYINSLGAAQYPLTLDPTFGYTSAGGSAWGLTSASCLADKESGQHYTATAGDEITAYSAYASWSAGGGLDVAPYSVTSNIADVRLTASERISIGTSYAWYSVTGLSQSLSSGVTYVVGFSASSTIFLKYDSGAASKNNVSTLPATWSNDGTMYRKFSVYATYTEGGGGSSIAPFLHHYKMAGGL